MVQVKGNEEMNKKTPHIERFIYGDIHIFYCKIDLKPKKKEFIKMEEA